MRVGVTPRPPSVGGRSAAWRRAAFAALDFETTGLDLTSDAVISFGVVPVDGGRARVAGAVRSLVEPAVPPSPRSQTIHELRPQDLADAPGIDEARALLGAAIGRRFLLAWFADVELHFLGTMFGGSRRRWRRRTIDVRSLAIAIDREPRAARGRPGYGLTATAERYGVPVADPHEALDDALVTAQLFLVLASKVQGRGEVTVRQLLRAAGA